MHSAQFQLHADIEERHWWFVGRRQILCRLAAEVLPPSPQTRDCPNFRGHCGEAVVDENGTVPFCNARPTIIDIGCGTGGNVAALADRYRCVGIDTSEEAIALARQRFPQVRFIAGRAPGDLGELASQARLFLLTDVLEHVADDYAMFSELLAAASPGCLFLVTVPANESLWSEHDQSFGHYRRYDRSRLEGIWAGLPVTPLLISYFNSRLLPLVRLVRAWNRRRGRAAGRAGTDFWLPTRPVNSLLTTIFAGEARRLVSALRQPSPKLPSYRAGASLVAVVRRDPGPITIRVKPAGLLPDHR